MDGERISEEEIVHRASLINAVSSVERKGTPGHKKGAVHAKVYHDLPHLRPIKDEPLNNIEEAP